MSLRRAALSVLALSLTACAAAPPPLSPGAPGEAAPPVRFVLDGAKGPNEIDNQMLAISKADEQIERLFPRAAADKETARKKSGDADGAAEKPRDEAQALSGGAGDRCATACRALASMASSAAHLCKLAGEGDGRCEDARGRVRGASARVRSVCPTCAAGAK